MSKVAAGAAPGEPAFPWATAITFAVTMFVVGSDLNIVAPLLVTIAHGFRVSVAAASLLVAVFAACYALASPLIGVVADRVDRRRVLLAGVAGFVLFDGLAALAPSFGWLMVLRGLAGAATSAITPTAYAMLGDLVNFRGRGRAMAIASMGMSLSTVAGVPLGLLLAQVAGWRGVLAALALAAFLMGGLVWATVRASGPPSAALAARPTAWLAGLRGKQRVLGTSFLAFTAVGLVYTFLSVELHRRYALANPAIAEILLGYGACTVVGTLGLGWLGDRIGKVPAVQRGQLLELVALLGLGWTARQGSLGEFVAAGYLFALSQAYVPDLKALASYGPAAVRGRAQAWNNAAMFAGMMVGSGVAGPLFLRIGFVGLVVPAAAAVLLGRWLIGPVFYQRSGEAGPAASSGSGSDQGIIGRPPPPSR